MSAPTPAPRRTIEAKKPIPAPRTLIPVREENIENMEHSEGKNTFSRRVRTISNASKQIAGDIGGKVQEGTKAVMETIGTTRASVRRMTRRFTNNFNEVEQEIDKNDESNSNSGSDIDLFSNIQFNSPLFTKENVYNNIDESTKSSYFSGQSPPAYPPPPLRDELYDKPHSLASGSTTSSEGNIFRRQQDYESVFPIYPYSSDTESCVDMTAGTIDRHVILSRSESWNFYDPLPKQEEPVYNNVDSTPVLSVHEDNTSEKSFMRTNSMYENHEIITTSDRKPPTKSILLEFDPLAATAVNMNFTPNNISELSELEQVLQGDLYGNINVLDNMSMLDDASDDDNYISPPPPPIRFDSLIEVPVEAEQSQPSTPRLGRSMTSWYIQEDISEVNSTNKINSSKTTKWINILKKAPDFVKGGKTKESNVVQRPTISPKGSIQKKGMLYRITKGPVEDFFGEYNGRWCVLNSNVLTCYADSSTDNIKEQISSDTIISIQILHDQKTKNRFDCEELYSFEVNVASKVRSKFVYASKDLGDRRIWMQLLAECLTSKIPSKITTNYTRMGWTYIKEGLGDQWKGAWLVLRKRELLYILDDSPMKYLDLRKARCFKLEAAKDQATNPRTADSGPNLVIHFTSGTFYFRMWTQRETKVWCRLIKQAAQNNGSHLLQQQLTKNDVPVLVEKCINFIYVHGSMTEGIYRRAGSNSTITDLLGQFRSDAWSVQLTDKYTNHDVATALKRFFRDLTEPLIDKTQRQYLYQVSLVKIKDERIRMYKSIFDEMQQDNSKTVTYNTTRFLLKHIHFISSQCKQNLMTIDNLSAVWGPTLLQHDTQDECEKDRIIAAQLIKLYPYIFPEDTKELEQERKMLTVLEKYVKSPQGAVNIKSSGDFRVWVYEMSKEGDTHNILIGPQKSAYEILCELSPKINIPVEQLVLEESVLGNNLTRPIHHTEKVLDVVLKWGYWDDGDRKDNCLILNKLSKYNEYIKGKPTPLSAELKFADTSMKQLKPLTFEFLQAKLNWYKDKFFSIKIKGCNIEDIIWYFGHEPKRNTPTKYTITFIEKSEKSGRTKAAPFFGNVICWQDVSLRAVWLSSMWNAEHPNDMVPPPQHINLMSS